MLAPSSAGGGEPDWKAPLPVDPALEMGRLPNGLNYWIRKHQTPPGKLGIWLQVGSGSLNEDESQRGLAHFIEHLAFDGTANFPPGTLVKYFESLGLRFGQHQNAFTSFDQTTYMIYLPDTQAATVAKGLQCLADFGSRMLLLPQEIEKERRVILEEMRARKGVGQRLVEKMLPLILPGSRVAERLPIGLEEVVVKADRARFKEYYAKWYRPDLATLLVVGDMEPSAAAKLIGEQFQDWRAEGATPATADPGAKAYSGVRGGVITDPELTQGECMVMGVRPLRKFLTWGDFRERLIEDLGAWIVNRRLADLIQKGGAPFQSASVSISSFLNACTTTGANATGQPERWAEMLKALLTELKRAREHGFLAQEFEDARKAILAGAEQATRTESTWDARAFLARMNRAVAEERRPLAEAQRLELLRAVLPAVQLEEVAAAFARDYAPDARLLLAVLPEKQGVALPSQEELLALAREVEGAAVAVVAAKDRPAALLDGQPAPGEIAKEKTDDDLEIQSVTFANGARVHLRTMDFKKDQVFVRVTLFGGKLRETAATRGLSDVAALVFRQPASARRSSIEVRDLLTGKNVALSGWAGEDGLCLRLSGSPDDIEEGLRLVYLLLTEGRVEESALKVWRDEQEQELEERRKRVEARMSEELSALLSGGDVRFAPLSQERIAALSLADGQAWLDEHLRRAPLEAAIVGDLERGRMLELARTYLGSLPERPEKDSGLDGLRKIKLPKGPLLQRVDVETITPRASVAVGWRGADWKDVKNRRLLQLAAMILDSRLREEIREKRGLTYSVGASAPAARTYPGTGLLAAYATADPQKAGETTEAMRQVIEGLALEGPTETEMTTVRKQVRNQLDTLLKEPTYWLDILADMQRRETKLSDVKEVLEKMTSYRGDEVHGALKKYVKEERRLEVRALPKAMPEEKKEAPAP